MRRAAKTDTAQPEIVKALRKLGFSVRICSSIGDDGPDLYIGKHGYDAQVELKTLKYRPKKPKTASKSATDRLSDGQAEYRDQWRGAAVIVAYDLDTVLFAFGRLLKLAGWVK